MRINIPYNKRHFAVAEEVRDRCVVASAATATWRNVNVVDVHLLAIGHCVVLVAVKSLSCPSWRFMRHKLVGQLGFLDCGNVDIIAVEEFSSSVIFSLIPLAFH